MTFLIALIVSKLVLVVVFLVAITQVATPDRRPGLTAVTEPIAGIVLLGIAAFAPYMVYRLISFVGFDLYNSMGAEQDAKNAMNRPLPDPHQRRQGPEENPRQLRRRWGRWRRRGRSPPAGTARQHGERGDGDRDRGGRKRDRRE